MKDILLIVLLLTLVSVGAYWYQSTAAICPAPLAYRIGEVDTSFGITREKALEYALEAETKWEQAIGRDLFTYNETADFPIHFIYDERQELADTEASERAVLDAQREESESVILTVEKLQAEHHKLSQSYDAKLADYEARLEAYNTEVNRYNDRGGAPADVYEGLESERVELRDDADELAKTAAQLNDLAANINKLGKRGNDLVADYNTQVTAYNEEYGFSREFTQGDYQGDSIHIYKFSNENELVKVLMHEFGHALGIDHVAGESSVMYYLLENPEVVPKLSEEDLAAFELVCGYEETTSQRIRRIIRELL
ncbi:MAG: matrixin family metalloprotease [Candidatus Nomurabacteria bacterium]|nr:MAG: matrixin family metalloprotease [Candidatus Nomurabacteria bacterium]